MTDQASRARDRMATRTCLLMTLAAASLVLTVRPAGAQDSTRIGCAQCLWRTELERAGTWTYKYDSDDASRGAPRVPAAELQILKGKLSKIAEIARATPVMTALSGVNAWVWARTDLGCGFNPMMCRQKQLGAWEDIIVDNLLLNVKTGQRKLMNIESPRVHISINDPTELYAYGGHNLQAVDEDGNPILTFFAVVGEVGGLPLYDNQMIVVAAQGKPLFVAISRERFIRSMIKGFNAQSAKDPDYKPANDMVIKDLNAELAEMSPAERALPAMGGGGMSIPSNLMPPGQPGGTPLVIFNPNYFDQTLPRTAIQLIVVRTNEPTLETGPLDPERFDARTLAVWALRNTIDYARLRTLMDVP
jgi:hypothetical protein